MLNMISNHQKVKVENIGILWGNWSNPQSYFHPQKCLIRHETDGNLHKLAAVLTSSL